ncbi:ABC transporter substrate-binding protein [Maribrevibacterium harenarium]|uniref:ABC transporter substrate-binding protein n=1 Tax=Maribrevibacterium harenarium TaxID=2589817 RepID=A0A501WHJ9_9GAMM|nr:ABC transporter substrate-binding protein [Maribrevibacterium harenarium]TPE46567.1 ABC transporter substrate-binding protein [Maribrevibacterium harenarium]
MKKLAIALVAAMSTYAMAENANHPSWSDTLMKAKGQTVYWNAWGGADNINDYIQWVADRVEDEYQVQLEHVKLTDTAHAVSRVLAEKVAGQNDNGSVDLIWINGENFRAMKEGGLLFGPFAETLPNYQTYVTASARQSLTQDFGTPVEGMESPWGMAQVVFMYDTATLYEPPKSMHALLDYAKQHPGRVTYPRPPQFLGSTFLKQALSELTDDPSKLQQPVASQDFDQITAPLWAFLDELHPVAWRSGTTFPGSSEEMMRLLDDQEIDIALSFDVSAASVQIAQGNLPDTVRTYVLDGGTIGNTHFVAIPFNSSAKEGAQVVANFLLSPEAQAYKQEPTVWGDLSVLDYHKLEPKDQARFDNIPKGIATLSLGELGTTLPEPHVSWMEALEQGWRERYAN